MNWLSPSRVRGALCVGAAVLGDWCDRVVDGDPLAKTDRVAAGAPLSADQPETLAPFPEVPVTVLVIGVDADRLGAASNQAAPKGPPMPMHCCCFALPPRSRFQVLQIPTELGVQLPGEENPGPWLSCGDGVASVFSAMPSATLLVFSRVIPSAMW